MPGLPDTVFYSASAHVGPIVIALNTEMLLASGAELPKASFDIYAALLLGQAESYLQYLEAWFGESLDFRPCESVEQRALPVMLRSREPQPEQLESITLYIPSTAFIHLPEPKAPLVEKCFIDWPMFDCRLAFQPFAIASEQSLKLEPHGMVLIPTSFSPHCAISLSCSSLGLEANAKLASESSRIEMNMSGENEAVIAEDASQVWRIGMERPISIRCDSLLWPSSAPIIAVDQQALLDAPFVLLEHDNHTAHERYIARGKLCRIFQGLGLVIDTCLADKEPGSDSDCCSKE
jgi:hypothetical protein